MLIHIPIELLYQILYYLDELDLYIVTQTCRRIKDTASIHKDLIAKRILIRYGIHEKNIPKYAYDTLEFGTTSLYETDDVKEIHLLLHNTDDIKEIRNKMYLQYV